MNAGSRLGPIDRLVEMADELAGSWVAQAAQTTSAGQERAVLRMFGVAGLDRSGRPLAAEVVEQYAGGRRDRLARGVALPFAAALLEYDLPPTELALDIASGAIDLGIEAEILDDPGRRADVESMAHRLAAAALERADANRTARRELIDVLGDVDWPWIGAAVMALDVEEGAREAAGLAIAGVDAIRVDVPAIRELGDRLHAAGLEVPFWRPRPARGSVPVSADQAGPTPSGSQRGLAELRQSIDAAAAERRSYARLETLAQPLAAPEQAVVAAFERIDLVHLDPVAEIVDGYVDPQRAIADHAFARRLLSRAGATLIMGPGPLIVAPDLARGQPSAGTTRAGRALALQLVGVAMAAVDAIPPERIIVGALPNWLLEERDPTAAAIAQVAVRRAALPAHPFAFDEPDHDTRAAVRWPAIVTAVLPVAGPTALVVRSPARPIGELVGLTRAMAASAAEVATSIGPLAIRGRALEYARATVAAAISTLEQLSRESWPSLLAAAPSGDDSGRMGADAVVERTDAFDPFEASAAVGT